MVVFQKLEGKTTTLKFQNQKFEGKTTTLKNWIQKMEGNSTTYSQKLCFDRIFAWKEHNFPSGFLTNTILNFAQECSLHSISLPRNMRKFHCSDLIQGQLPVAVLVWSYRTTENLNWDFCKNKIGIFTEPVLSNMHLCVLTSTM